MKRSLRFLTLVIALCMLLSSCQSAALVMTSPKKGAMSATVPTPDLGEKEQTPTSETSSPKEGTYNEGVALVKYDGEMNDTVLASLDLASAEPLFTGSSWYTVTLNEDADTVETVGYLRELGCFDAVDFDYVMTTGADTAEADVRDQAGREGALRP